MCHISRVTCHVSHVIFFLFFFSSLFCEAYRWRVCYQRGLPLLVFVITYNHAISLIIILYFKFKNSEKWQSAQGSWSPWIFNFPYIHVLVINIIGTTYWWAIPEKDDKTFNEKIQYLIFKNVMDSFHPWNTLQFYSFLSISPSIVCNWKICDQFMTISLLQNALPLQSTHCSAQTLPSRLNFSYTLYAVCSVQCPVCSGQSAVWSV